MSLDHVIYVADHTGLDATASRLAAAVGAQAVPGGVHTTFGTHNALIPLGGMVYLEVVAVLDETTAATSPFGSAVAALQTAGGGWLGWAVRTDDPAPHAQRLSRPVIGGGRRRPDGVELAWRQVGTDVLTADPLLPFFLTWDIPPAVHPAAGGPDDVRIESITLAGTDDDRQRLLVWLGEDYDDSKNSDGRWPTIEWTAPTGRPGLESVVIGSVRI